MLSFEEAFANMNKRLKWVNDRIYWTSNEIELHDLEKERNILKTIIAAFEWTVDEKKGKGNA